MVEYKVFYYDKDGKLVLSDNYYLSGCEFQAKCPDLVFLALSHFETRIRQ